MSFTTLLTVVTLGLTVLIAGWVGITTLINVLNIDDAEGKSKANRVIAGAVLLGIALIAGNTLLGII